MVFFRPGNLYSLCSPGKQHYQKIIHLLIFTSKKVEIDNVKVVFLLELVVIINESLSSLYIFDYRTLIADFRLFR